MTTLTAYNIINDDGIFHYPLKNDGSTHLTPIRLCDPFTVVGHGHGSDGTQYHVIHYDDNEHCIIARGDVGTGEGWRQLRNVINIPSSRRKLDLLTEYIQEQSPAQEWLITDVAGWHNEAYILPNGNVIGDNDKLFFNGKISHNKKVAYSKKGTLLDWQANIGQYATENSRICLLLGVAFASPLLKWLNNIDGGIFHLFGNSSAGKTTAQRVAQSVWSGHDGMENWNTTAYALINNAAARNNGLLSLDEMGEDAAARSVDQSIYALANGKGRALGAKDGGNRPEIRFKVLATSSGESSLETHMSRHGRTTMAGQLVRCPSIPHTLECHHDFADMRSFTDHLNDAVSKYYGSAGQAFIETFITNFSDHKSLLLNRFEYHLNNIKKSYQLNAQTARTARLFVACITALEIASDWKITGFSSENATSSIYKCFEDWLEIQPQAQSYEVSQISTQALEYMQVNEAFFQNPEHPNYLTHSFPGYVKRAISETEEDTYYVFPKVFREHMAKGFDEQKVKEILHELDWLQKSADKRWVRQLYGKSSGGGRKRLGCFLEFSGIQPKKYN